MKEQAIAKIKVEMEKDNDAYIKVVGDMLLKHISAHPADAEKIIAEDKSISGSISAMTEVARKKQKNSRAVLTDEEGFEIVLKYFEIDTAYNSPGDPYGDDFATDISAYL